MIINNTYKFIFIHIAKSGGTTITGFFSKFSNGIDIEIGGTTFGELVQPLWVERFHIGKHTGINGLINILGRNIINKYFIFTFVRNPYDRFLSAYNFMIKVSNDINCKWIDDKSRNLFKKYSDIKIFANELINDNRLFNIPQVHLCFLQQYKFISSSNEICTNFIGKIENLEEDLNIILNKLHINYIFDNKIQKLNVNKNKPYTYDEETLKIVKELYRDDFKILGYDDSYKNFLNE